MYGFWPALDFVYAYIDDLLIASEDEQQRRDHLRTFERLKDYGVVINPAKYEFGSSEITFLGYTVNADGIKPLVERVKVIVNVPKLATKQLRRYPGMINFYQSFIPAAAKIFRPLNNLLKDAKKIDRSPTVEVRMFYK